MCEEKKNKITTLSLSFMILYHLPFLNNTGKTTPCVGVRSHHESRDTIPLIFMGYGSPCLPTFGLRWDISKKKYRFQSFSILHKKSFSVCIHCWKQSKNPKQLRLYFDLTFLLLVTKKTLKKCKWCGRIDYRKYFHILD